MEKHLRAVTKDITKLYSLPNNSHSQPKIVQAYTMKEAEKIQQNMSKKIENQKDFKEDTDDEAEDDSGMNVPKITYPVKIHREKFFKDMSMDQKVAGDFLLQKLEKQHDNDQLLMFLHGSPGTGKSFFVKRLKNFTNALMRITATSGIAAMSLNGSTIDYLLDKRYGL